MYFPIRFFLFVFFFALQLHSEDYTLPKNTPSSSVPELGVHDIDTLNIHDPAILADPISRKYYVYDSFHYGQPGESLKSPTGAAGVEGYWSEDLISWHGPELVYAIEEDSWANRDRAPWAPEVSYYNGKYYLFLTFHDYDTIIDEKPGRPTMNKRGSQILVSDSPMGPFKRFHNHSHTPENVMALDGTLYVEDGQPWMIYCHEWVQIGDGLVEAIRLTEDLSDTIGEPIMLINAADVDWTAKTSNFGGVTSRAVVTDGPWPFLSKTGKLMLLWSSWNIDKEKRYTTSLAYSDNGKITGKWTHRSEPLIWGDRGHGNIFRTFDGELMLALHRYFNQPYTRLQIWRIEDQGDDLRIIDQAYGHR